MKRTHIAVLVILSACTGSATLSAQQPRPLQIRDMFEIGSVGAPVVSPDGVWIALRGEGRPTS